MSVAGTEVLGLLPADLSNVTAYAAAIDAGAVSG